MHARLHIVGTYLMHCHHIVSISLHTPLLDGKTPTWEVHGGSVRSPSKPASRNNSWQMSQHIFASTSAVWCLACKLLYCGANRESKSFKPIGFPHDITLPDLSRRPAPSRTQHATSGSIVQNPCRTMSAHLSWRWSKPARCNS